MFLIIALDHFASLYLNHSPMMKSQFTMQWYIHHCQKALNHIDGIVQERRNTSVLTMELPLSCTHPLECAAVVSMTTAIMQLSASDPNFNQFIAYMQTYCIKSTANIHVNASLKMYKFTILHCIHTYTYKITHTESSTCRIIKSSKVSEATLKHLGKYITLNTRS